MRQDQAPKISYLWKLAITITLTITLVFVSRIALIAIIRGVFTLQNYSNPNAWESAQTFVTETGLGQAIAATMDALLMLILVYAMITRLEKTEFSFREIGLDLRKNTLLSIVSGLALGSGMFFMSLLLGVFLNFQDPQTYSSPFQLWVGGAFLSYGVFNLMNSLWQEIVFRGYLQKRAVENYGKYKGVLLVSFVFILIHGLVQTLTPMRIISGLILFILIGLIFEITGSLYFVTVMHATLNYLVMLYQIEWKGVEVILTYSFALLVLILTQRFKNRMSFS